MEVFPVGSGGGMEFLLPQRPAGERKCSFQMKYSSHSRTPQLSRAALPVTVAWFLGAGMLSTTYGIFFLEVLPL